MVRKIVFALCIALFCSACSSEVKRLKETEYLRTQPGKPLVYPGDVDRPAQEKTYVIPESPKAPEQKPAEAPELLVLPPRLAGVDVSEDPADDGQEKPAEQAGDEVEGFIDTQ